MLEKYMLSRLVAVHFIAVFTASYVLNSHEAHAEAEVSPYEISWQTITSGATLNLKNVCYKLSGSLGQTAIMPAMAVTDTYTLFAGFWSAAPAFRQDQLFFSGFEDCSP